MLPAKGHGSESLDLVRDEVAGGGHAYCGSPLGDGPCGVLPHDVTGFNASSAYTLIERTAQDPFDLFSWRTFVALNWPAEGDAYDDDALMDISKGRKTTWQTYSRPGELGGNALPDACGSTASGSATIHLDNWLQSGGFPLVDRNGNYVLYDVRLNPVMADYIRDNDLVSRDGQERFHADGEKVSFPMGHYDNGDTRAGGAVGSLTVKSSWRILPEGSSGQGMVVRNARVAISPHQHLEGEAVCLDVRVGMVGMHIVRRTRSANGDHWIWSTFEHVDNAPRSRDARGPNNVFGGPLFPMGCRGESSAGKTYAFYDGTCPDCPTNLPPSGDASAWRWSSDPPHARFIDGSPIPPAQVVRCWNPATSTEDMNRDWRARLAGTALENYALSTTQWKGADLEAIFPAGEVPRFMTNSSMETYIQTEYSGSCLGCHRAATTADGRSADFTFILGQLSGSSRKVPSR